MQTVQKNQLYYGDNLGVLREHIKDESVDLIYLDPPFNSRQDYNVLFAEKDGTCAAEKKLSLPFDIHAEDEPPDGPEEPF